LYEQAYSKWYLHIGIFEGNTGPGIKGTPLPHLFQNRLTWRTWLLFHVSLSSSRKGLTEVGGINSAKTLKSSIT
jgi:hypothetical protein